MTNRGPFLCLLEVICHLLIEVQSARPLSTSAGTDTIPDACVSYGRVTISYCKRGEARLIIWTLLTRLSTTTIPYLCRSSNHHIFTKAQQQHYNTSQPHPNGHNTHTCTRIFVYMCILVSPSPRSFTDWQDRPCPYASGPTVYRHNTTCPVFSSL